MPLSMPSKKPSMPSAPPPGMEEDGDGDFEMEPVDGEEGPDLSAIPMEALQAELDRRMAEEAKGKGEEAPAMPPPA